jgi:hypothetical protein
VHQRTRLLLVLVTALFVGCPPPSYGIFRSATIEAAPDLACVRGLLENSGATSIEFYDYEGGRRVTWRGLAPPSHSPSFIYTASGLRYALQFHIDPGLSVVLSHVGFAERDTPASTLRDIRAHLQAVDRGVQGDCEVRILSVTKEECRGQNCSDA